MRILVLSDTHGDFNRMMKAVTEQPTAEVILSLIHISEPTRRS